MRMCKNSDGVLNTAAVTVGLQSTKGQERRGVTCKYIKRKKVEKSQKNTLRKIFKRQILVSKETAAVD